MGLIVDLCEEGSCIPYLMTWRQNRKTFLPMILEIFKMENKRLKVKTSEDDVVLDIENAIMGKAQHEETYSPNKDPNSSPALMDLLASCRPKVYAIFKLMERHKEKVDIINEHFKIHQMNFSYSDEIILIAAENYLALKLGETWVELGIDLKKLGLMPLGLDQNIISILSQRLRIWSLNLKTYQEYFLKQKTDEVNYHL